MTYQVVGIDPGLVHTGVVMLWFNMVRNEFSSTADVVDGLDADEVAALVTQRTGPFTGAAVTPSVTTPVTRWSSLTTAHTSAVVIEAYRPRSHYQADARMIAGVNEIKRRLPGAVTLDNTGVKKIVTPALMKRLGVWSFPTATHHQDLRSAARIALYAMLKDDEGNRVLTRFLDDELIRYQPWTRV